MQRVFIEWCAILALLLGLGLGISVGPRDSVSGRIESIDAAIYDLSNKLWPMSADPQLAIIEIDEASLAQIGRWPWPRGIHAALLGMLTDAKAEAIGLDILMAESADDDQLLADAIRLAPPVVLPVASETDNNGRSWPIYPVHRSGQVSRLGHAHFNFDRDGVVRGLHLEEGGNLAFAVAAHAAAKRPINNDLVRNAVAIAGENRRNETLSSGKWERSGFVLLPASEPVRNRYSYAEVLRGDVDRQVFAGKVVFIGATATGMRDAYSNSIMAGQTISTGVDLHSAAFNALGQNKLTVRLPFGWHCVVIVLSIVVTMLVLYLTSPRYGLAAVAAMALLVVAASLVLLKQFNYWMPPGGTVIAVLLAYPLWSWRRLELVISGLIEQSRRLESEPELLALVTDNRDIVSRGSHRSGEAEEAPTLMGGPPALAPAAPAGFLRSLQAPSDPVSVELGSLRRAATRVSTLRLLLITALERLPHAALIASTSGRLIIRNRLARESFAGLSHDETISVWQWLADEFGTDLPTLSSNADAARQIEGLERRDRLDRDWLIDAHHVETDDLPALWLIQFTDISKLRALQREREEMMRFISHDLRSPQISILSTLAQLPEDSRPAYTEEIKTYAERALSLAESFIQWTRAENKPFEQELIDLASLAVEAADSLWTVSHESGIPIQVNAPDSALLEGDAQLLRRAISNLIENAIKYGPKPNFIAIDVEFAAGFWTVPVDDQGPGLGDADAASLFEPYVRGSEQNDRHGTGLGLAFVRMVAERHGGWVKAENKPDRGARFRIALPAPAQWVLDQES